MSVRNVAGCPRIFKAAVIAAIVLSAARHSIKLARSAGPLSRQGKSCVTAAMSHFQGQEKCSFVSCNSDPRVPCSYGS